MSVIEISNDELLGITNLQQRQTETDLLEIIILYSFLKL